MSIKDNEAQKAKLLVNTYLGNACVQYRDPTTHIQISEHT